MSRVKPGRYLAVRPALLLFFALEISGRQAHIPHDRGQQKYRHVTLIVVERC